MDDATLTLIVLLAAVGLFIWNRLPIGSVAIMTALALAATGVVDVETALAGFGDPIVIFIATLFVVSEGIDSTGVTSWAGQTLMDRAGDRKRLLVVGVLILVAVLSAVVTPNGSTAALIPLMALLAMRMKTSPSQLLMPLAFTASAGALLALTGSPVNVIVSDASAEAGAGRFGFFEFAVIGLPLVVVTIAMSVLLGPRLVPVRSSRHLPPDLSDYGDQVAESYDLGSGFARLRMTGHSPLLRTKHSAVDLTAYPGTTLVGVQAANDVPQSASHRLADDDVLVLSGPDEQIDRAADDLGLLVSMRRQPTSTEAPLLTRESGAAEIVIRPRSSMVGQSVFPGMVRGDLVLLAVRRLGKDRGPVTTSLVEGDTLLVRGPWQAVDALVEDRDVLVVDAPDLVRRQAVPLGRRAKSALTILAGMVVLLSFGLVPPAVAGLLAATSMVLLGVVGAEQAYRAVSWQTVVLIGGLIPLSAAITNSGLADRAAAVIVDGVGQGRPMLLLVALFGLTAVLGQVVSNTATVLVVTPIAVAAALETGVAVQPVLMIVAVAGAASLLTPLATPANTMVMAPGGYAFSDYWKLGLPVLVVWLAVALLIIPLVWPL
ncbi:MAG: SLC13 family permease [Jiangellales bacterium]